MKVNSSQVSFRSSGDTLTRENFYKMKSRLAEKRLLTMKATDVDTQANDDDGENSASILVKELRKR